MTDGFKSLQEKRIERRGHQGFSEFSLHCPTTRGPIRLGKLAIYLSQRPGWAPACTIRHPVWQIVALQRRVRFSARLAGFRRGRCHQRRARRAERASFSVFVSNLDFRVPRLRQIRGAGVDRAVWQRKRGHPRGQNRGRGYRSVAGLARSGPGGTESFMSIIPQAWVQVLRPGAWHPVPGRCFPEHLKEDINRASPSLPRTMSRAASASS